MAYKTFVVERTEDESTQTAGPATLNRADVPPLVKVFDDESDIVLSTLSTNEIVATKNTDYSAVAVVDRVAEGNLNPVTSNAVAGALSLQPFETVDLSTATSASTAVEMPHDGFLFGSASAATQSDGPVLTFQISSDGGTTWNTLAYRWDANTYSVFTFVVTIPVAKGDKVYLSEKKYYSGCTARWFKWR